jgi:RNA polymerase sigma-70 factor (ECF subfamily)
MSEPSPTVEALHRRGQERWPKVGLSLETFARALEGKDLSEVSAHAEDLYLAIACGGGDAAAIAECEHAFFGALPAAARTIGDSASFVEDALQLLRQKLFVGEGGAPPRIRSYGGRGALAAWLRMGAVRAAIDLKRSTSQHAPMPEELPLADLEQEDLELAAIKKQHREDFKQAFQHAFEALPLRDKQILKLQLIDRLTVEQISALYDVHRATLARWMDATRTFLLGETRRRLQASRNLDASQVDSMLELVQSQLDVSLTRLLRRTADEE